MGRLLVRTEDSVAVPVRVFEPAEDPWAVVVVNPATARPPALLRPFRAVARSVGPEGRHLRLPRSGRGSASPRSAALTPPSATGRKTPAPCSASPPGPPARGVPWCSSAHGFGGQLVGLVDEMSWAAGAVLVGSTLAHWRHWQGASAAARPARFWYLIIPVLTRLLGHLPSWGGLGVPCPRAWRGSGAGGRATATTSCSTIRPQPGSASAASPRPSSPTRSPTTTSRPGRRWTICLSVLGTKRLEHRRVAPRDLGRAPSVTSASSGPSSRSSSGPTCCPSCAASRSGRRGSARPGSSRAWRPSVPPRPDSLGATR